MYSRVSNECVVWIDLVVTRRNFYQCYLVSSKGMLEGKFVQERISMQHVYQRLWSTYSNKPQRQLPSHLFTNLVCHIRLNHSCNTGIKVVSLVQIGSNDLPEMRHEVLQLLNGVAASLQQKLPLSSTFSYTDRLQGSAWSGATKLLARGYT